MSKQVRLTSIAIVTVIMLYAAVVSLSYCLSGDLNHDEHQFMASAFMVAQYGLHPYQDFAYFHMPNLVYLYAPFFFTQYPFLLARIFVGICGFGICFTIFLYARALLSRYGKLVSITIPICITVLFLNSQLYKLAASHVWNHTPATFFTLLAFLLHCRGIRFAKRFNVFFFSGMSLGMAIGIRLSFAPLIIPFLLAILLFHSGTFKTKGLQVLTFCIGGLLANVVAIYFFFTSFQDFWFGNIGYASLNTLFKEELSYMLPMTLVSKFTYLIHLFIRTSSEFLVLLACLYSLALFAIDRIRNPERLKFELLFILMLLPFLLFGCLAPSPSWQQYYFTIVPFIMLLSLYALSSRRDKRYPAAIVLPFILLVAALNKSDFTIDIFTKPQTLSPIELQRESEEIRSYIDVEALGGKILTLSPLYAVSSKLPIYEEFVTGPFAWRVSHLLSEEEAISRGLPLRTRIKTFVKERRPCAILTGKENEWWLDKPLNEAAKDVGYYRIETSSGLILWRSNE